MAHISTGQLCSIEICLVPAVYIMGTLCLRLIVLLRCKGMPIPCCTRRYELHRVCAQLPCCMAANAAAADPHAAHHHPGSPYYYPGAPPAVHAAPYGYQVVPLASGAVVGGQLGHPINPYGTRYGSYGAARQPQPAGGHYVGFWGWLRSPSGSAGGFLHGIPVGRADRPQYPPPAILSPPYSDQRFPMGPRPPLPPPGPVAPPPPSYFPPMGSHTGRHS